MSAKAKAKQPNNKPLANNMTVWINVQTEEDLKMYSNQMGMIISLGKNTSYVKIQIGKRTHYDFIPNNTMRLFVFKHKDE